MSKVLEAFLHSLLSGDNTFNETMAFIERHYHYHPHPFDNGPLHNAAGENQGSCKILGLALLECLTLQQTLLAFGEYYRAVLDNPDGSDHPNIRQLIKDGLKQVNFKQLPLQRRG